jgi:hypothetical protein
MKCGTYLRTISQNQLIKNIPYKMLTYKHRLPWVHNKLRKMINKKNKLYYKMKKDKKYQEK